ncbi:MAG: hypothetical protein V4760_18180 [Bdellovibrionota bacterium]
MVSSYDSLSSNFISETVSMGIDNNSELAVLKSLTEYCERRLSRESEDPVTRLTKRTDGFAAFPCYVRGQDYSRIQARENALNEATERYLWARWWDDHNSKFQLENGPSSINRSDVNTLINEFNLKSVRSINVTDSLENKTLTVLIAETFNGGFVTGGSASNSREVGRRELPAFGELLRHLIVFRKMEKESATHSFYEQRLFGFASGNWADLVRARLASGGTVDIVLPSLEADSEVCQSEMDLVSVHRCLYSGQPEFMGGPLERLCI